MWLRNHRRTSQSLYQKWIAASVEMQKTEAEKFLKQVSASEYQPLISIVMPVYNVEEQWLRSAIESVLAQSYANWELCIADDNSSAAHIKPVLEEYAARDSRIKVTFRNRNGHISAASNTALESANGDYVALLDNDDELAADALLYVVREILNAPNVALIYTDEDKIDEKNERFDPTFKPDWSADLFYSLNFVNHLAVFRRDILTRIGNFREEINGSQDYDLILRFIEQINESQIRHVPRILYHWRAIEGSVATDLNQKTYAHEAARKALRNHFERRKLPAKVTETFNHYHRVIYELPNLAPKVSIIIEGDKLDNDFAKNLFGIINATEYLNLEIIVGTKEKNNTNFDHQIKSLEIAGKIDIHLLNIPETLPAQRLNELAQAANGEILVFLDTDLIPLNADWLREIVSQTARREIGAIGGKILYKNGDIKSAGYILGIGGILGRAHHHYPRESAGNLARLQVTGNFSAVSIDCLAVKKQDFITLNGFDAPSFPQSLFDADFCLRLKKNGKRILFTPYAELKQVAATKEEEASIAEKENFRTRWQTEIENDSFYNSNLTKRDESFQIEFPPRFSE